MQAHINTNYNILIYIYIYIYIKHVAYLADKKVHKKKIHVKSYMNFLKFCG